jgi:hypothetical protein
MSRTTEPCGTPVSTKPRTGKSPCLASDFMQPRMEGEIAFLICKPLREPNITARQVLAATDACALGIEIVASRIADWKIELVDTIADNASYDGFTLGPWDKKLRDSDLSALAISIRKNGARAGEGLGSAVLGNPAIAAAWLANKLVDFGVCWNLLTWSSPAPQLLLRSASCHCQKCERTTRMICVYSTNNFSICCAFAVAPSFSRKSDTYGRFYLRSQKST